MADTTTVVTPPLANPPPPPFVTVPPPSSPPFSPVVGPTVISADPTLPGAKTPAEIAVAAAAQVIRDKEAAKVAAKKTEPTDEEVLFVAKAMDYDSVIDFDNPSRCANAKTEAKRMILGYRACARVVAEVKASAADKPTTVVPATVVVPQPKPIS